MSRPPSPIKKTFQRLLSPSKSKQQQQPQLPLQSTNDAENGTNWTYAESTSSSGSSSHYSEQSTGWSVINTPPLHGHNKENVSATSLVEQVMARTPKLQSPSKQTKQTKQDQELDKQFEELMVQLTLYVHILT